MFPEPRIAVIPDQVRNAGEQIIRLAVMVGIKLDDAQRYLAEVMSGVGEDGRWSAFEVVIFAPRQNLKSEFCLVRILAGLFLFNEQLIVYSAHRASTTTKLFKRLKRAVDRCPQLGGRIVRVSNRIGAESIELQSGQVVEMCARSTSSGRGYTGDLVIFDESHELDSEELAAILPMVLTRPRPQVLYALSLGNEKTSHVGGLRERALAGKPGVAWVEWSMGPDDQVSDRACWRRCNPAVAAGRVRMERLESLYEALGEDNFAVEHLGRATWPTGAPGEWLTIGKDGWEACAVSGGLLEDQAPVPAAASVSSRPFDPFAAWGPSGVPPWVGLAGLPVLAWDYESAGAGHGFPCPWSGPALHGRYGMAEVGWAGWLADQHEDESPAQRSVRLAKLAEQRDDREADRDEAERRAAVAERHELVQLAAMQAGVAARSVSDVFADAGRLGDEDAAYCEALKTIERIDKRRANRQRDAVEQAQRMSEVTGLASRSATITGGPDLLAGAKQAHRDYVTASRARMRDAATGTPRQPRPFAGHGNAVRSEHCIHCIDANVTDEQSYLLHSGPELNVPVTPPSYPKQAVPAERRTPMIYAGTEISR